MRNEERTRLIRPLAFCAILSIATFSGIGIAAITGQLSVGSQNTDLFQTSTELNNPETVAGKWSVPVAKPTHIGLTRPVASGDDSSGKPMVRRVGHLSSQLSQTCKHCGVVQSIERHALEMPRKHGLNNALAMKATGNAALMKAHPASVFAGSRQNLYEEGNRNFDRATSFIVRLRMEDGSYRTIYEHQHPQFSIGEKVQLVDGSVISIG